MRSLKLGMLPPSPWVWRPNSRARLWTQASPTPYAQGWGLWSQWEDPLPACPHPMHKASPTPYAQGWGLWSQWEDPLPACHWGQLALRRQTELEALLGDRPRLHPAWHEDEVVRIGDAQPGQLQRHDGGPEEPCWPRGQRSPGWGPQSRARGLTPKTLTDLMQSPF